MTIQYIRDTIYLYVEIFVGILFHEIVKKLALQHFLGFNVRKYVACLALKPVANKILTVFIFMNAD